MNSIFYEFIIFHIFDFLQRAGEMNLSPWDQIPCPEVLAQFSAGEALKTDEI